MGLYQLGWTGDNGDPDNFLCYFFCGDKPKAQEGFFVDLKLNDVLRKAAALTDQAERAKLYQQAESIVGDNAWRIFVAHSQVPLLFRAEVTGFRPVPTGSERYRYVTVAAKK
jgi:ABC-type transport system substrate-binding protein